MSNVKAIPEGQEAPIAYLAVKGAASAIDWYKKVFGAKELFRVENGGMVGHAELAIGGGRIFLADEYPDMDVRGPKSIGGTPVTIHLYVEDVDALAARAAEAGATFSRAVETQFYGDRGGKFEDPFGHQWWIATHVEDLSPEEMKRRAKELFGA